MQRTLQKIADAPAFVNFVTVVILIAGFLVGAETYSEFATDHASLLHILDAIVLWIFVLEIAIKMGAEGKRPWRFFKDSWNVFDFVIVGAAFLPFGGNAVTVLRLLRLLRVLKLVRALPKLQVLVGALLKSIPSMGYVSVLLLLLFYIYAVAAVFLFSANDPLHFGNLQTAMLSLFRVVTLEDWTDIMYINMYGCAEYGYDASSVVLCTDSQPSPVLGALFFVSFVLIGTMIMLNLFIGVIMTGMSEAQAESEEIDRVRKAVTGVTTTTVEDLQKLESEFKLVQETIARLHRRMKHEAEAALEAADDD